MTVNGFGETTEEGETFTVTVGAEQLLFGGADGAVPVQVLAQPIVPVLVFVWPQAFSGDVRVQVAPYPDGLAGVDAEQEPLQLIVPELVEPHALAADVHTLPYPDGFAGVEALQVPLHCIVPALVVPQAFADDVQAEPYPDGFAGVLAEHAPLQPMVPEFV